MNPNETAQYLISYFEHERSDSIQAALFYCDAVIEKYNLMKGYTSLLDDKYFYKDNIAFWNLVKFEISAYEQYNKKWL